MDHSIDFDMQVKDIHFFNEKFSQKSEHPDKIMIESLTIHIKNLNCKIFNFTHGKVYFHYKLVMDPDIGEISFDGNYTIFNPEKQKLAFIFQNAPKVVFSIIKHMTYNHSIKHAEEIANEYGIYFPSR